MLAPVATYLSFTTSVDQITEAEWNDLLPRFADASIYQSWSYGAVCWGAGQLSHLVLKRDGEVVGMAQVRVVRLPVLGKGIAYIRWGPLCRREGEPLQEEMWRELMLALKAEYAEKRRLMLRIVPNIYDGDPAAEVWQSTCQALGFTLDLRVHVYRTMRVDLTQSLEDLRKGLHQRWRNYLKNAEKAGYTIRDGANVELYDTFLLLYRQMMARKQFDTTVDVAQFKTLQQALPSPLKMQVFLCEREGRPLNALVVSHVGESAIYLLAATGDEGLKERGAHLLQWRAMLWLKERGCRWYDVGGINPDRNPGVYQFKSGLGGQGTRQLGGFEHCTDSLSSLCVAGGEKLQAFSRGLGSILRRR
jgi:lipid II:glycine glycyltransferase (peptidoglycan interpeptide bridge formation enzyme)